MTTTILKTICLCAVLHFFGAGNGVFGQTVQPSTKRRDIIFTVVEQQPEFPGGDKALKQFFADNIVTPKSDQKHKGRVFVSFVVNTDGSIQDIELKKSLKQPYDLEALRVVGIMPKWIPGSQSGMKVRVRYMLPVEFD